MVASIVFWVAVATIVYVYFLYPALLAFLGLFHRRAERSEPSDYTPSVSVIVSAYNEALHIGERIADVLSAAYPRDRLEVIIGSDGSSDGTEEVARKYEGSGVRVLAFDRNRGKTAVEKDCAGAARGEVLVFTDAACRWHRDSLKNVVAPLRDPRVGCVAGRMVYVASRGNLVEMSQGLYWNYESLIRRLESDLGSMVGVDGPLYAVRREAYVELPPESDGDLIEPLALRARGYRVVLAADAPVYEEMTSTGPAEFRTRKRVVLRGLMGLWRSRRLLAPWRNPWLCFQVISHKLLRWSVGFAFLAAAMASAFLWRASWVYAAALVGAVVLLAAGIVGGVLDRLGRRVRWLCVPYYFLLVNTAASAALIAFFCGRKVNAWVPERGRPMGQKAGHGDV